MQTLTVTITKVTGGYQVELGTEKAVATTPRQTAQRAKELIEAALSKLA